MGKEQEAYFLIALENYKDRLFRVCKSYAATPDDAQDLFQDVLLQLWKSLPGFKGQSELSTWMYRVALNVCMQAKYSLSKREQHVCLKSVHFEMLQPDEQTSEQELRHQALHRCIRQLNDSDRSVIVLFLDDIPYKDIAAITGISENHVAVKVKRIKDKLLTCLTK